MKKTSRSHQPGEPQPRIARCIVCQEPITPDQTLLAFPAVNAWHISYHADCAPANVAAFADIVAPVATHQEEPV